MNHSIKKSDDFCNNLSESKRTKVGGWRDKKELKRDKNGSKIRKIRRVRNHVRVPRHVHRTASLGAMVIGAIGALAQAPTVGALVQALLLGEIAQALPDGEHAQNPTVTMDKCVVTILV